MKKALICGVSGQDGALLAKLLIDKGYEVVGTSRDAQGNAFNKLEYLGIVNQVKLASMILTDFRSVFQTLNEYKPDEVYNLAGQSSVSLSFEQPVETLESISIGTLNLLESIRFSDHPTRLYNACSSECFGDTGGLPANEDTPFRPRSPYATAKAAAFWEVANYREAYGLFSCSGVLFNHESSLRPERFVTQKIVSAARSIALGNLQKLQLGNIDIKRDWGWAPEYVEAMWLMLQEEKPDDFVIATGESNTLQRFLETAFAYYDLDWKKYVVIDKSLYRPSEIMDSGANPGKAQSRLGWTAKYKMNDVAQMMCQGMDRSPERL